MSSRRKLTFASALVGISLAAAQAARADQFYYPNFGNTSGLTLVGNAATTTGPGGASILRVVPAAGGQSGAAYSTTPFTLGAGDTFSTQFSFNLNTPGGVDPADGFTFVLAANPTGLGGSGFGLGYAGVPNSVAIEFDTYFNGPGSLANNGPSPPNHDDYDANNVASSNHIAIDTSGNLSNTDLTDVYGIASCGFPGGYPAQTNNQRAGCLSNGDTWTATITYDGANLGVTVNDPSEATSFTALSNVPINIAALLGTSSAYVGFTGSTGSGNENDDILSWQFANTATLTGPTTPPTQVPEPSSLWLLGSALAGLLACGAASTRATDRRLAGVRKAARLT